ncbi:MAG: hypothetical protein UX99_C0006G0011 [Candidatus Amesbacteria bacterium GW2011_GWB1_47_26]|uniref:DUF4012 domain-containing protein n=1 Tax=Candidatus Amesbacteria bacterium GW2011_GWC2_45_19 TaxID=1618366 RepID=A0A0G1M4U8_9BACT|nr:MAG: hypothetical protein UX05_C0002G0020 [Candidatus Amesbacteria bacterium GW2011_GWC2_45_19]KKU38591.1 MAG: hypothetical protein UX52_C0003G0011 [Candidatus Amesbacteria bacterium GW2011_GWA1_46_35]KKU69455.1 MAG: hypothetical protein UX93_C0001G0040 [Microgenomates group bacterium GW2011_GWC1_47_20]KKU74805.1 MAG: hypothetical protein UX99_C0006G0011 [Candidatus Amesbacteria bacterium GW2011_GWB1_47_26]KKU79913.1 MAG: hypothetical protein UY06_C0011G0013 [Candidatus Amesbacteria bacteriu
MPEETLVHPLEIQIRRFPPVLKIILIVLAVLLGLTAMLAVLLVPQVKKLLTSVDRLKASGASVVAAAKAQDLKAIDSQLDVVEKDLAQLSKDYSQLSWLRIVPIASLYYADGQHGLKAGSEILDAAKITVAAIAPYADLVGLKGLATSGDGMKTAQDRVNFVVETLDKVRPRLTQIGEKLAVARSEADKIKPSRYPKYSSQLTSGIALIDQAASLVNDAKPLLESAPYILGKDNPRKYLVLFQNDAELRPTGGFMTAYAVIEVSKGKINIVQSNDIYTLDDKFPKKLPAPEPIKKYLPNVPYWYLRDQNLSPDFKVSMDTFYPNYLLTKSPAVDGIIAVDTQLLVDLLKVTGPIGVSGFGNYSAEIDKRCNCPQVFYELEKFADIEGPVVWDSVSGKIVFQPRNYGDRKSFIGPMMHSVMTNVFAQPKKKMSELFNTALDAINGKHVQFYFINPDIQRAVESFNLAGRVREYSEDYLMVVDTNFAGAKTNAWVTYAADQKIDVAGDGTVTKILTLTYKNPQQYFVEKGTNLKLNGVFRDWLRVYVPQGSQLLEAKGFETGQKTSEDLGKTVFEGFFTVTPLNVRTITLKYKLPIKIKSPYKLLVQKQGGAKNFNYTFKVNDKAYPEFLLTADHEFVF